MSTSKFKIGDKVEFVGMKGEPEKTFIETGILDQNEELTPDGKTLLLNFLLTKYKDEFNKEVVTILKEAQDKRK